MSRTNFKDYPRYASIVKACELAHFTLDSEEPFRVMYRRSTILENKWISTSFINIEPLWRRLYSELQFVLSADFPYDEGDHAKFLEKVVPTLNEPNKYNLYAPVFIDILDRDKALAPAIEYYVNKYKAATTLANM